ARTERHHVGEEEHDPAPVDRLVDQDRRADEGARASHVAARAGAPPEPPSIGRAVSGARGRGPPPGPGGARAAPPPAAGRRGSRGPAEARSGVLPLKETPLRGPIPPAPPPFLERLWDAGPVIDSPDSVWMLSRQSESSWLQRPPR